MKKIMFILAAAFICLGYVKEVRASDGEVTEILGEELLGDMDFARVQEMMDEMLGDDSFSFMELLKNIMTGKETFSKEAVQELLRGLFFARFAQEKGTFLKILLLVLIAAVFSNFVDVFGNGQIGEVNFYGVYMLLFTILMDSFADTAGTLTGQLSWMAEFMKVLAPAYLAAVSASAGAASAAVFYEGILLLVWGIQWILLTVILPAVNLYMLLCFVNHLSKVEMLSKMSELLETVISWGMKSLLGAAVGLQVVKNLIAPVMDSLKRSALGKTAGAIPGIGNAVNTVTELVITSAVLVRNSLGVVALVILVLAGLGPVIHYGMLSLSYKFLAALSQPVSDKRIVGALGTMGEGAAMLLRILFTAEILCMLTFLVLMAGVGGL